MLTNVASDFIVTEPASYRKLPAEEYLRVIRNHLGPEGRAEVCANPREAAVQAYRILTEKNNVNLPIKGLIFTGSLYMIGEVRKTLRTYI